MAINISHYYGEQQETTLLPALEILGHDLTLSERKKGHLVPHQGKLPVAICDR